MLTTTEEFRKVERFTVFFAMPFDGVRRLGKVGSLKRLDLRSTALLARVRDERPIAAVRMSARKLCDISIAVKMYKTPQLPDHAFVQAIFAVLAGGTTECRVLEERLQVLRPGLEAQVCQRPGAKCTNMRSAVGELLTWHGNVCGCIGLSVQQQKMRRRWVILMQSEAHCPSSK